MAKGTPQERFWAKVDRSGPDDCWLWRGSTNGTSGYGGFREHRGGFHHTAHRYAYMLAHGPIEPLPDGSPAHIDHLCRVRLCVNPAHLERVTPRENNARALAVPRTMVCGRCHKETPRNNNVQKWCPDCWAILKVEYMRAWQLTHRPRGWRSAAKSAEQLG